MSQSVRPGNRERGWNDPPEFLHSQESTGGIPKRTILNQRVAHSLNGLPSSTGNTEQETKLSEPLKLNAPPTSQIVSEKKVEEKSDNKSDSPKLEETSLEEIEKILNAKVQYLRDKDLGSRVCDDILKRVKIFLTSWTKLNETVKLKMFNLTKHLDNSELSAANDIHVRLMLDFPSEVSQWMVGIKKLIHELIEMEKKTEATL